MVEHATDQMYPRDRVRSLIFDLILALRPDDISAPMAQALTDALTGESGQPTPELIREFLSTEQPMRLMTASEAVGDMDSVGPLLYPPGKPR